jgi:hypothetical protein
MTTKNPAALSLAEDIATTAVLEIRRLHEVNQELLNALKLAQAIIGHPDDQGSKFIFAAIAKAEGESK